jgi:hypothetical protein
MGRVTGDVARVLMVVNDVRAMQQIAGVVEQELTINGLSPYDALNAGTYLRVNIPSAVSEPDVDTIQLMATIKEFKPNVIVMLAGPEVIRFGIIATENNWQNEWHLSEAPQYVLSHHLFNSIDLRTGLESLAGSESRVFGVNYAGAADRSLYNDYLLRLKASYPNAYVEEYENYYDSADFALLSVIAAANNVASESITGDLVVDGFRQLIDKDGTPFELKPPNLSNIATVLALGDPLYLTGTLGPPDFDNSGARHSTAALWCLTRSSGAVSYSSGAVRFDVESGEFTEPGLSGCGAVSQ